MHMSDIHFYTCRMKINLVTQMEHSLMKENFFVEQIKDCLSP